MSRSEEVARIIDPVSFEKVRQGGQLDDAEWRCNRARDKAAHIETLFNDCAPSALPVGWKLVLDDAQEVLTSLCEWFGQREAGKPTTNREEVMFRRVDYSCAVMDVAMLSASPPEPGVK